jgi:hypothetical protein
VVTANVAEVALAATVTLAGTVADEDVLPSATDAPPVRAGPLSVTVPVGFVDPPCTVAALNPSDDTAVAAGTTVSIALWLPPPVNVAEMPDVAVEAKASRLVTVNVAEFFPDVTVTVAGTVAAVVLLLVRLTTTPLVGAVAFKVTVPVEVDAVPLGSLVMLVGFRVRFEMVGGFTVSDAVCCTPLYVAVIVAVVWIPTLTEVTVKLVEVEFAGTVTLPGTVAEAELLPSVTDAPPVGAGPFSVTVAIEFAEPPCTDVGFSVSEATPDAAATTVSVALLVPPPVSVAEMLGVAVEVKPSTLVTVKVAELLPEATVAVAGTVAAAVLLLARLTTTPPAGAVVFNVTVPVDVDAVPLG